MPRQMKLNETQRAEIIRRYYTENITQTQLAKDYGVSQTCICALVSPMTRQKMRAYCRAYNRARYNKRKAVHND